jgi:hypothetical protein
MWWCFDWICGVVQTNLFERRTPVVIFQDYERGTQIASGIALGFVGDIDWHGEWTAAGNLMDRKSTYRVELNSPITENRRNTEEM